MAEYIDRNAFLGHEIKLYCTDCDRRKNSKGEMVYDIGDAPCRACGICDVMDDAEDFPAADVRPRWIPVEEQLPKDEKEVLACYGFRHDGEMNEMRFIQPLCYFRFNKEPHWQYAGFNGLEITHWMPMPEPPKEEA